MSTILFTTWLAEPPSLLNVQVLAKLLPGHLIADAIAIIASIDFVLGEVDR